MRGLALPARRYPRLPADARLDHRGRPPAPPKSRSPARPRSDRCPALRRISASSSRVRAAWEPLVRCGCEPRRAPGDNPRPPVGIDWSSHDRDTAQNLFSLRDGLAPTRSALCPRSRPSATRCGPADDGSAPPLSAGLRRGGGGPLLRFAPGFALAGWDVPHGIARCTSVGVAAEQDAGDVERGGRSRGQAGSGEAGGSIHGRPRPQPPEAGAPSAGSNTSPDQRHGTPPTWNRARASPSAC